MKRSSSNNRVLKTDSGVHDVRPFLLKSVNISREDSESISPSDNSPEKIKIEESYKQGFADGINAGRLQILGEIEKELKILSAIIKEIEKLREDIYRKIEDDVVEISLSIAKKIIYDITERDREIAITIAREAIKRASDREVLKIKINPVDYETLSKSRSELLQCVDGIKSIIFEADESVGSGGCLIETKQGDIDARIDSQIKVIEGEIKGVKSQ